jgi:hypothetical protein
LDDTLNFLPCGSRDEAEALLELLGSDVATEFFSAFIFWDEKRPVKVDLLNRLSLEKLAEELGTCVAPPNTGRTCGEAAYVDSGALTRAGKSQMCLWGQ